MHNHAVGGPTTGKSHAWDHAPEAITVVQTRLRDHVAFYCAAMDACFVGDERAHPQPGGFYGGWITSHVVGPFKGGPGTTGW